MSAPTVVVTETFGREALELERFVDEGAALDAVVRRLEQQGPVDRERLEELCPYFGVIWPGARALGQALVDLGRERLGGRRVLELGCGLAAPALLAARLGARVVASDYHPDVPGLLARNAARNRIAGVEYRAVDWRREEQLPAGFDLVLAADVLYVPEQPALVARAVLRGLAPGAAALIADPARSYLQTFVDLLEAAGLRCGVEVRTVPDDRPGRTRDVFVVEARRPA